MFVELLQWLIVPEFPGLLVLDELRCLVSRGCSWGGPPLWRVEDRREERELVPQPDIPGGCGYSLNVFTILALIEIVKVPRLGSTL